MIISINGISVSYLEKGQNGLPIVILHGWGKKKEDYGELIDLLSLNHRVVALDLPGFGKTEIPPISWGVSDYANFMISFINQLQLMKVVVLGHSFGGRIAIKIASSYPEEIAKLILIDSAGVESKSSRIKLLSMISKFVPHKLKDIIGTLLGSHDYKNTTGVMRDTFKKIINGDLQKDMTEINKPTLIVWGKKTKQPLYGRAD